MRTFDVVILLGAVCGVLMVLGGFWLFRKGVISLNQKSQQEAVSLEFTKLLKVTSRYPALGFFMFGLAFIICAAYFGKLSQVNVNGQIKDVAADDLRSVRIALLADFGERTASTDGRVDADILPNPEKLVVEVTAPGYIPVPFKKIFDIKGGKASFGDISLRQVAKRPAVNEANIVEPDKQLATSSEGRF